jgi:TRAP-type C4-dicarboxylate transport system substrate-binding protein
MGVGHFGFRELLSTTDATTVEELSGLKMRVVNAEPYPQAAVVLGTTGTPIGISDVYMSLQTGVVDATENPVSQLVSMKFYEVAKYLILTDHMLATQYWIASNKFYDSLSAEDQAIVDETFAWIADRIEQIVEEKIEDNIQLMEDSGVTVIRDIDKQQFIDRLDLVFQTYPDWQEVYDAVNGL